MSFSTRTCSFRMVGALALASFFIPSALAQDGDRALLIVDPDNKESMYVANYYQNAYDIPASHVLYMEPGSGGTYAQLAALQLPSFLASLKNKGIDEQIDYVILPPGDHYKVSASGLVADNCVAVRNFALPSAYGLARNSDLILAGTPSTRSNQFRSGTWTAKAFRGSQPYRFGNESNAAAAERYFIGTMLGWTGMNGNTLQEILDLIDRSVGANGTHPMGTAYFMETTDQARSAPRHGIFPTAVTNMTAAGGAGQHLQAVLPLGQHDAMGIMTGLANPDILNSNYSLLPGSFADHLTSHAGNLTSNSQTKMTLWLTKGASGTSGAVEEPCNYAGKFPSARLHTSYRHGVSLGEAWYRHHQYYPFQTLFLGDSLVRPYDQAPTLSVPGAPTGTVSGTVTFSPVAAASAPGASILELELWVAGRRVASQDAGTSFQLDTTDLNDGWHEIRVRAIDSSDARFCAHWLGSIQVDNQGLALTLTGAVTTGDLGTLFNLSFAALGGAVQRVSLLHNERVVASQAGASGMLQVYGQGIGAGRSSVVGEVLFADGSRARSAPLVLDIAYTGGDLNAAAPIAFDYQRTVGVQQPFILELPALFDTSLDQISYALVSAPNQAVALGGTGSWRSFEPDAHSTGMDTLTFRATGPGGQSNLATVTIVYDNPCPAPVEYCPSLVNSSGLPALIGSVGSTSLATNYFQLTASQCPQMQFGIFIYGQDRTVFGAGDGLVCFQNIAQRLPIVQTDAGGHAAHLLDFSSPPQATGLITAGSTWSFQLWYRDTGFGTSGYNFSSALEVTFCP